MDGSLGLIFGVLFMVFSWGYPDSWVIATKEPLQRVLPMMRVPRAWMFNCCYFSGIDLVVVLFYMWDRVKLAGYGYGLKWIALAMMFFWLLRSIPYHRVERRAPVPGPFQ